MTDPMPLPDPDAWAERIRMLGDTEFGGKYRPGYLHMLATGTATPDDMVRIHTFVKALDAAKVARMNELASIVRENTPEEADLLNTIGEGQRVVPHVNRDEVASASTDPNYWLALRQRVAQYMGESGELLFPHTNPFAGVSASGVVEDPPGVGDALMWALEQITNVGGFLYRSIDQVGQVQRGDVRGLMDRAEAMQAQNYDSGDVWDNVAFNWNQGESQFRHGPLDQARRDFGDEKVDAALAVFRAGGLDEYMRDVAEGVRSGKITPEEAATIHARMNDDPEWANVYDAVDRAHVSFGRDMARILLPNWMEDTGAFTGLSGSLDAALMVAADPTLVGTKFARSAYMARYAVAAGNDAKLYRLYGLTNPRTGINYAGQGDKVAMANVEDFLTRANRVRELRIAGGREIDEAAEIAAMQRLHPQLMPLMNDVAGYRVAITDAEKALAEKAGTRVRPTPSSGEFLAYQGEPITTLQGWADYITSTHGLARLLTGKPASGMYMVPGRAGWWAERQWVRGIRTARAERLKAKTASRLTASAPPPASVAELAGSTLDDLARVADEDPNKIIAWEWSEEMKHAFIDRGRGFREAADGRMGVVKEMKSRWESVQRKFSTALPEESFIPFNAATGGRDMERFARLSLPKHEAAWLRAMWEGGTEATRRQIGRGIVLEVAEAAGLLNSTVGRNLIMRWLRELDALDNVRYGLGGSDEIASSMGGTRRVALNMSQMESGLLLPSFAEMKRAAARSTLLGMDSPVTDDYIRALMAQYPDATEQAVRDAAQEAAKAPGTFGEAIRTDPLGFGARLLTYPTRAIRYGLFSSRTAEAILSPIKLGYILTFSNLERNLADEYLTIQAHGRGAELREGKRLMRASGQVNRLTALAHHLIPRVERAAIATEDDVARAVSVGRYRLAVGDRPLDEGQEMALAEYAERAARPELERVLGARDYTGPEGGVEEAVQMHRAGLLTERVYAKHKGEDFEGYNEVLLGMEDGGEGLESLAAMYVRAFGNEDEPARRALAYIMWHEAASNRAFLDSLDDDTLRLMQELAPTDERSFRSLMRERDPNYVEADGLTPEELASFEGAALVPPMSPRTIRDYVLTSEKTARFRQQSEYLRTDAGGRPIAPGDTALQEEAARRYVDAQLANVAAMVTRRDGESLNPQLVSDLLHQRLPSSSDLRSYGGIEELPAHVVQAQFLPAAPKRGPNAALAWYTGKLTSAYEWMVTRPMQRMIRKPMFVASYVKHRQQTQRWELRLIGEYGWKPEEAKKVAADLAWGQALNDVVRLFDNPNTTSQFSVLARNWWMFQRAQEDAIRRWWRVFKERPETVEKAHLWVNGAFDAGILEQDTEGNLTLAYPGSGAIIEGFMHIGQLLGLGDRGAKIPHVDDLTSQLKFMNPSVINPFGYSASPVVSIPLDMLAVAIPGDELFKQDITSATQGEIGANAGRGWYEVFMPTAINRLVELMGDTDSLGSTVGSAAASAMQNAANAGQLPDGSNTDELQDFRVNLETQTWNALLGRAVFAFFAPGATGLPELYGQGEADWTYREQALTGLHDEYRAMLAEYGYEAGHAMWVQLHPDKLVFDVGRTEVGSASASVSTVREAANWMYDNRELFDESNYRSVAAYFVPDYGAGFDRSAWNSMLEIGVRQYKDTEQFYRQVLERNAVDAWFTMRDREEADLATARANGTPIADVEALYAPEKERIMAKYPILSTYLQDPTREARRQEQVLALERMVNDPSITSTQIPDINGVVDMLQLRSNYDAAREVLSGQTSDAATAQRKLIEEQYNAGMQAIVERYPGLADLYQGVFRYLQ